MPSLAALTREDGAFLPVMSWVVSSIAGLAIFAFALRRRRDHDEIGPILLPTMETGTLPAPTVVDQGVEAEDVADAEADIPRWRRPSLQAARKSRLAVEVRSEPIRFAGPPPPGVDRRVVGYRLVRVADAPDDVQSAEVGRLDRDDEVDVLETSGEWTRVRGADGLEGWVPTVTVISKRSD